MVVKEHIYIRNKGIKNFDVIICPNAHHDGNIKFSTASTIIHTQQKHPKNSKKKLLTQQKFGYITA